MENAGWLVAYGAPVGGIGSGLGKVGWAAASGQAGLVSHFPRIAALSHGH